jgi:hypothetical protein
MIANTAGEANSVSKSTLKTSNFPLQRESVARSTPVLPAAQPVNAEMLEFVSQLRHLDPASMTVCQFWREVARYGGLPGRIGDGEPGWQILWPDGSILSTLRWLSAWQTMWVMTSHEVRGFRRKWMKKNR